VSINCNENVLFISCHVTEHCEVEVKAYSSLGRRCKGRPPGFVKLNGGKVWAGSWCGKDSNHRGVNILEIDPFKCRKKSFRRFDTYYGGGAPEKLRDYLKKLDKGSFIVGVTGDEPRNMLKAALPALKELGVDVHDVKFRGSFAFVAVKSYPAKTVLSKVISPHESFKRPAYVNTIVTGISLQILFYVVTVGCGANIYTNC